jgi:mannose-6-phosphate isomerase-like protein (cupin superfamily)
MNDSLVEPRPGRTCDIAPANAPVSASVGDTFWVLGHKVTILPTGNDYTYVDIVSPGRVPGPPPHRHPDCTELFHLLEGGLRVLVEGQAFELKPGESLLVPRNTVHTFEPLDCGSRVISVFQPGGFDRFFREMGIRTDLPDARTLSVSPDRIQDVLRNALRFQMEIVLPD